MPVLMLHVLVMIEPIHIFHQETGNTISDIVAKHVLKWIDPKF